MRTIEFTTVLLNAPYIPAGWPNSTGIHRNETGFHWNGCISAGIDLDSAGMRYIEYNSLYIYNC